jgi:hypothetical protein
MVLTRQQWWEEAQHAFQEAVSLAHSMPHPYLEARALYEWGRMLLDQEKVNREGGEGTHQTDRDGDCPASEAQQLLERAYVIFEQLGAQPYFERTQQLLPARELLPSHHRPG